MNTAELQTFCLRKDDLILENPEAVRGISSPWSMGRHTFATNARIMIRIPRLPEVPNRFSAPNTAKLWLDHFMPAKMCARFVDLQLPAAPKKPDSFGYRAVRLGPRLFHWDYLVHISVLPDLEVAIGWGDMSDPLAFRFTGGEGLLMPMKFIEETTAKRERTAA